MGFETSTAEVAVPESGSIAQSFALVSGAIEEITVTGYRLAQITALQDKKAAASSRSR